LGVERHNVGCWIEKVADMGVKRGWVAGLGVRREWVAGLGVGRGWVVPEQER
jgi:hypothetical protein